MKSNFHSHQILYVKGIGYARLAIGNTNNAKSNEAIKQVQINQNLPIQQSQNDQNNDAVLFDPDMFNIDADSPFAQTQVQINLSQHNTRKKSIEVSRRPSTTQSKNRELIIVPLKLQQTNVMIYCPQTYLMKKINLRVKSLLQNNRRQVTISIQITKTIDNLKNQIFKQLGEEIGYYSDIKIYSTAPKLQELNVGSKTIWQYYLKDRCRLTIGAKFIFAFKILPQQKQGFALSNGNNTITSTFPIVKKQQPVASTTTVTTSTTTNTTSTSTDPPKVQKQPVQPVVIQQSNNPPVVQQAKKQQIPQNKKPQQVAQKQKPEQKPKQVQKPKPQKLHIECNSKLRSGIHYWQFKIDKLSNNANTSLVIGVCLKSQGQSDSVSYINLWGYDLIRSKKIQISSQKLIKSRQVIPNTEKQQIQQNGSEQSDQQYGSMVKVNDSIGVLLIIKQKSASLIFYKNSICLEECYQFNVQKLKLKQYKNLFYLCPFVTLSGQAQLSLDSKAAPPLDSYRFK